MQKMFDKAKQKFFWVPEVNFIFARINEQRYITDVQYTLEWLPWYQLKGWTEVPFEFGIAWLNGEYDNYPGKYPDGTSKDNDPSSGITKKMQNCCKKYCKCCDCCEWCEIYKSMNEK